MTQPKASTQFSKALQAWQQQAEPLEIRKETSRASHNVVAHIKPLHKNVAIVEFPLSKGGGWSYYKNAHAVRKLQAKGGYKVTWL